MGEQPVNSFRVCRNHLGSLAAIGLGIGLLLVGVLLNGFAPEDLGPFGAVVILSAVCRYCITPALRPQSELFEAGYAMGYNRGHYDGRRAPLVCVPDDASQLTDPQGQHGPYRSATYLDGRIAES